MMMVMIYIYIYIYLYLYIYISVTPLNANTTYTLEGMGNITNIDWGFFLFEVNGMKH